MKMPKQALAGKEAAVIPPSGSSMRALNMADYRNDGLKKQTGGIKLSSDGHFLAEIIMVLLIDLGVNAGK